MITQIKQIIDDSTMVQNVQFTMQSSIIQLINNLAIFTSKHMHNYTIVNKAKPLMGVGGGGALVIVVYVHWLPSHL